MQVACSGRSSVYTVPGTEESWLPNNDVIETRLSMSPATRYGKSLCYV